MHFYFWVSIFSAAGQMQPRLARLIPLGHTPAEHPVSTEWLSVSLSLSRRLNLGGFTAALGQLQGEPAARSSSRIFALGQSWASS